MTSGCESSLPDPLESYHQVYKYLVELGYKCSTNLPARAVKQNKLSPRQGGGFSKASVRRFAQTHKLRRTPAVDTPSDDRPALPVACDMDDGPAAERARQQARLARIQADKMELALERDRGNLVPAADQAITLASFAAVVEHEIKAQMRSKAAKLLAVVHGDSARKPTFVRELTDMVDAALRHAAEIEEYRVQFESLGREET